MRLFTKLIAQINLRRAERLCQKERARLSRNLIERIVESGSCQPEVLDGTSPADWGDKVRLKNIGRQT